MKRLVIGLLLAAALPAADGAAQIMLRVAGNQDRAQQQRSLYRFHQNVLVRVHRSNGKLAREEMRDYSVAPTPSGFHRDLLRLSGKVLDGRRVIPFDKTEFRYKHADIDGEIVTALVEDLGGSRHGDSPTRDGIDREMFPLSTQAQQDYDFTLQGQEEYRGRQVYRITFTPKKDHDTDWAGEALIDKDDGQPVLVTTHLASDFPAAVKILLGTNFKHVGFKVAYQPFGDGVWFPVSYGGELQFRVLFLYSRRVSMGLVNSSFEKADVQSTVRFDEPQ